MQAWIELLTPRATNELRCLFVLLLLLLSQPRQRAPDASERTRVNSALVAVCDTARNATGLPFDSVMFLPDVRWLWDFARALVPGPC